MNNIKATVVADSKTPMGERLTTLEVVFPRYILAEKNTHRVMSKNSASSRAIPLRKMLLEVIHRPFIPYAFQKDHRGMQGAEYFDPEEKFSIADFMEKAKEFICGANETEESFDLYVNILNQYKHKRLTLAEWWLIARDKAVEMVTIFGIFGVTKQLANRLLEPFMWHKVLISATEWENFFNLRCPQYTLDGINIFKSRKELKTFYKEHTTIVKEGFNSELFAEDTDILAWLRCNKGQADIHMMFLAEAIYDAINESTPKELKEGEWHIPYGDNFDTEQLKALYAKTAGSGYDPENPTPDAYYFDALDQLCCKISIARCARLSYQTLGDNPEINYEKDLELYEVLSKSGHWSPFEHVARVMNDDQYHHYTRTMPRHGGVYTERGWCRNFKGFIQYRELLD